MMQSQEFQHMARFMVGSSSRWTTIIKLVVILSVDVHSSVFEEEIDLIDGGANMNFKVNALDYDYDLSHTSKDCQENHPFTYAKCLRLCDPDLNPTCMDDQLCFCNPPQDTPAERKRKKMKLEKKMNATVENQTSVLESVVQTSWNKNFGTSESATCLFSDFCEELCKRDEGMKEEEKKNYDELKYGIQGALCKMSNTDLATDVESCVCTVMELESVFKIESIESVNPNKDWDDF